MSAAVRSGYVAAKSTLIDGPSESPKSAARRDPTAPYHRAHIGHARLERRCTAHRIGHAGAALVEFDQPRVRGHLPKKRRERRQLPGEFQVGDVTGHEIAATRIASLGRHCSILARG